MIRVAFDIGGTFTDFVLTDDSNGATHALKVPTSSRNPGEAVIQGLEKLLAAVGVAGGLETLIFSCKIRTRFSKVSMVSFQAWPIAPSLTLKAMVRSWRSAVTTNRVGMICVSWA